RSPRRKQKPVGGPVARYFRRRGPREPNIHQNAAGAFLALPTPYPARNSGIRAPRNRGAEFQVPLTPCFSVRPKARVPQEGDSMLDLIIRGGNVVTPEGVINCDIGISGETITALAAPGTLPVEPSSTRVIDATGHIVMPGGIDPHVHLHHVWIKPD